MTLGVVPDGQWHQYVATFDGQNCYVYEDGRVAAQNWISNTADSVGPANLATFSKPAVPDQRDLVYSAAALDRAGRGSRFQRGPDAERR